MTLWSDARTFPLARCEAGGRGVRTGVSRPDLAQCRLEGGPRALGSRSGTTPIHPALSSWWAAIPRAAERLHFLKPLGLGQLRLVAGRSRCQEPERMPQVNLPVLGRPPRSSGSVRDLSGAEGGPPASQPAA